VTEELLAAHPGCRILDAALRRDVRTALERLIGDRAVSPRIAVTGMNHDFRIRLRRSPDGLRVHLLNQALEGIPHPTAMDRWGRANVLNTIKSTASGAPLVFELDVSGLGVDEPAVFALLSPELAGPRPVSVDPAGGSRVRVTADLSGVRLYAVLKEKR